VWFNNYFTTSVSLIANTSLHGMSLSEAEEKPFAVSLLDQVVASCWSISLFCIDFQRNSIYFYHICNS